MTRCGRRLRRRRRRRRRLFVFFIFRRRRREKRIHQEPNSKKFQQNQEQGQKEESKSKSKSSQTHRERFSNRDRDREISVRRRRRECQVFEIEIDGDGRHQVGRVRRRAVRSDLARARRPGVHNDTFFEMGGSRTVFFANRQISFGGYRNVHHASPRFVRCCPRTPDTPRNPSEMGCSRTLEASLGQVLLSA